MSAGPDVSIVIPAYRAEATIGRAIRSLFAQRGLRSEVIVVVDGNEDGTLAAARSFSTVKVLVNERNAGAPAARNRGLEVAGAPLVMFLDADDYVEGPLLSALAAGIRRGHADVALGPSAREWPDGVRRQMPLPSGHDGIALVTDWLEDRYVPPCSVLWRRSFVQGVGGWDEGIAKNQDGDLLFRAVAAGAKVAICSYGLGVYTQHTSAHRISAQNSPESFHSRSVVLERALSVLPSVPGAHGERPSADIRALRMAVAKSYYACAVEAFDSQLEAAGAAYLARARSLGLRRHVGSPLKRLGARVIGLRRLRAIRRAMQKALSARG